MMEGHLVGGRLARRPSAAVQPVLDLRLQPGHDRGPHRHHVHRGRRRALHRLRLERHDGRRRQRPRRHRPRLPHVQGRARAPDARSLVHSHIGYGSPVEDSPKAHGEPFGPEGVRATKRFFGLPEDQDFYVPDGVYDWFASGIGSAGRRGPRRRGRAMFAAYRGAHPDLRRRARSDAAPRPAGRLGGRAADVPGRPQGPAPRRDSSGQVLNAVARPCRGCSAVPPTSRRRPRRT